MKLISSQTINNTVVDGYYDTEKAWFTREQIGLALEYTDPIRSVSHIHNRHKGRLDPLSVVVKLTTTDGKAYDMYMYSFKGVLEICRWSKQPKADEVMDKLYDMAEEVMKKGYYSTMSDEALLEVLAEKYSHEPKYFQSIVENEKEQRQAKKAIAEKKITELVHSIPDMERSDFETALTNLYRYGLGVTEYNRLMKRFEDYQKVKAQAKRRVM